MIAIEYHVHIWQVLPQLSCGDANQIRMWFKECNRYLRKIENFAYVEINEQNFNNPTPVLYLPNTSKARQNGRNFADDIFKCILLNKIICNMFPN